MSNLLSLPVVVLTVQTSNNEDWLDSVKFVVDEPGNPQVDITGIIFEMEVRRSPTDREVITAASTENGTIVVGTPPDFGFLIINLPLAEMKNLAAGVYVADVTGRDGFNTRVVLKIALTIVQGITLQPVNKRVVVVA